MTAAKRGRVLGSLVFSSGSVDSGNRDGEYTILPGSQCEIDMQKESWENCSWRGVHVKKDTKEEWKKMGGLWKNLGSQENIYFL